MAHLDAEEIASLRYEIANLFTPSTPIKLSELFAGRLSQIDQLIDAVAEPGRHAIIYGERGVGKTSLSQILEHVVPSGRQRVVHSRKACDPSDTFETIWKKFFRDMRFVVNHEGQAVDAYVSDQYPDAITPDDVLRELKFFGANDIPIFVIDEFNELRDNGRASSLMANTIKALSDEGAAATIVVVGVGDSVTQLFSDHGSISRCMEEVLMPRMTYKELGEIIDKRMRQLGMTIQYSAKRKILLLSRGLPTYVHRLGKHASGKAVSDGRLAISEKDVDDSILDILNGSLQSLRDSYSVATASNQPGNLFKEVLLACALARADDSGYFVPAAVRDPLEKILQRQMTIAQYQNHLGDWHTPKRGAILQRTGEQRSYRFRFAEPAMQPYVLMKGVADGMVGEEVREFLKEMTVAAPLVGS